MVLRIERIADGQVTILRLFGRIQSEHLAQLKTQIEVSPQKVIVDMEEVRLVDREVVCFLGTCETMGVELCQCPLYIREWINREKRTKSES